MNKSCLVLLNIRLIFLVTVKQQQTNSRPSLRFILDSILRPNSAESSTDTVLPNNRVYLSEKILERQQGLVFRSQNLPFLDILSMIYEELKLPL